MRIPAYCSFSFIEDVTNKSLLDYMEPEKISSGRSHFDLLELIAEGLQIKTDVSDEKIEATLSNPYIKFLKKNNRIVSDPIAFSSLRVNCDDYFINDAKDIKIYFLSNTYQNLIGEFEQKSGYHFLTQTTDTSLLFEEEIETFQKSLKKSWEFSIRFFKQHHSIIIADPYLFTEKSIKACKKFFKHITPQDLKGKYHVTLIGSDNRKGLTLSNTQIRNSVQEIENQILAKANNSTIEFHIYNNEDFHDRIIITNNTCLFSGYGLDIIKNEDEVQKEGIWIAFKPFRRVSLNGSKGVLFYQLMKQKLESIKKWVLKSNNPVSSNPLFN